MRTPRSQGPQAVPIIIAASRSRTQAHVLAGLLHDLNGPLNNIGLTLDLLGRALAPHLTAPLDETGTRLRRYLDALTQEFNRLAGWSRGAGLVVHPSSDSATPAPLSVVLDDACRLLRHHATLAEVRFEIVPPIDGTGPAILDATAVRAALLTYLCAAIDLAHAGSRVVVEPGVRGASVIVRIVVSPSRAAPEAPGGREAQAWMPESPLALDLLAGRLQVEALNGASSFVVEDGRATIEVTLPRA